MKNEPQPEYAKALTREQVYRSEREATRHDSRNPEVEAEERDWEAAVGDGIQSEDPLPAALADQVIQGPGLCPGDPPEVRAARQDRATTPAASLMDS
jgi:hypothetical protein